MAFSKPTEIRRSFARDSNIAKRGPARKQPGEKREKRIQRTNYWPGGKLNYEFLESCKEVVCRVKHPTAYMRHLDTEYRVSTMPWSRGYYVDIRQYKKGGPTSVGILLHLDVIAAILPDLIAAVHKLELLDDREPEKKAKIEVIQA